MRFKSLIILLIFCTNALVQAQGEFYLDKKKSDKIKFELINNLIVFPVEVNGVELSFLLDTGVSKPIIFNFLNISEALQINQTEKIFIKGLGDGLAIEALKSVNNIFRVGDAINFKQELFAIFDPSFNFAPQLGVPIHGIIGYDFLKDFIVEINYVQRHLRLMNIDTYKQKKCKRCEVFDLEFNSNKPYIDGFATVHDKEVPVKLLIDSGGSDALWLFEDQESLISVPENNFEDFLGRGLSGTVYGKRSRIKEFRLNRFKLKNVNAAFPDSSAIHIAKRFKERSGSLSGDILKRFTVIFDYSRKKVKLRPNRYFDDPFTYNKSGMVLEHDGVRPVKVARKTVTKSSFLNSDNTNLAQFGMNLSGGYEYLLAPSFKIVELRYGSPALEAGLQVGDVILNINGRGAHSFTLQEIMQHFYDDTGKTIKMTIDRNGMQLRYKFNLKDIL